MTREEELPEWFVEEYRKTIEVDKFPVRPHMCEAGARKQIIEDLLENICDKVTPEQVNECLRNPENS